MRRHSLDPRLVNLDQLRKSLSSRLGYAVEILTSESTDTGPGELVLENPTTGEHLDVDPDLVATVIAEVSRDHPQKSSIQRFIEEFDDIPQTPSGHALAIRNFFARALEAERKSATAMRQMRNDMRFNKDGPMR